MATLTAPTKKRKVIDIDHDTFRTLSMLAVEQGTNLKAYIEGVLRAIAEDYDDSKTYAWLLKNDPEIKQRVSAEEKMAFEAWLKQ